MTVRPLDPATFDWATGTGGADTVRAIADAAAAYDGRESLNEAARLCLRHHGLEAGLLLVGGPEGEPTGFGYLHGLSGPGRPGLELVVAPRDRGRGTGTELLRAVLDAVGDLPLTAWSHGNHPAAAALAERGGFDPVRELWLMRRPAGPLPPAPVPPGVRLRAFRPGHDETDFLAVNAAAFAHHPEQGGLDLAGLRERMAEDWFDPAGLILAEQDGRLAGFHWTKVHDPGSGDGVPATPAYGEVYVIGVSPSAQGSGLGRLLLVAGLEHLQGRGLEETVLYVEADNVGAVRLYESFGFGHAAADTDVMYARRSAR